jgi:hypothetical protein
VVLFCYTGQAGSGPDCLLLLTVAAALGCFFLNAQGKLGQALADYNASIKLCPWSVDPVINRGVALEALGRCVWVCRQMCAGCAASFWQTLVCSCALQQPGLSVCFGCCKAAALWVQWAWFDLLTCLFACALQTCLAPCSPT